MWSVKMRVLPGWLESLKRGEKIHTEAVVHQRSQDAGALRSKLKTVANTAAMNEPGESSFIEMAGLTFAARVRGRWRCCSSSRDLPVI